MQATNDEMMKKAYDANLVLYTLLPAYYKVSLDEQKYI